jgi:hypothetical protein
MATYRNVTNLFNNQDKRFAEAVVMTCPAMISEGSHRTGQGPVYIQSGDAWTAAIIEGDSILKRAYLVIDEAFPAGATLDVDIAGTAYFTNVAADSEGLTVSVVEDNLLKNGQTITVSIASGAAGTDVTEGVCRIVIDSVSPSLKNGNYAVA